MKNWTIGQRILAGFSTLLLIAASFGLFAVYHLQEISKGMHQVVEYELPGIIDTYELETINLTNYLHTQRMLVMATEEEKRALAEEIRQNSARMDAIFAEYAKLVTTPKEKALQDEAYAARARYGALRRALIEADGTISREEMARRIDDELHPLYRAYFDKLEALVDLNEKSARETAADIDTRVSAATRGVLSGLGGALVIGMAIALFIIVDVRRRMKAVATTLSAGASEVAAASSQIASTSQELARGATEQAASLEETSASLEEMAGMTRSNANDAGTAKELSSQTRKAAEAGVQEVGLMTEAMDAIKSSSDNIAKIIKTIDEIAFQTNLLALNAAVEAARAGEAGAGFAVVADEVRSLAQRSATAAKETEEKIQDAIAKGGRGVELCTKVSGALREIVDKARRVDDLVGQIATASHEQSAGIGQINTAMSQMDTVTQRNAAGAEETAAAAESLSSQATVLESAVADLRALVEGRKAALQSARDFEDREQSDTDSPSKSKKQRELEPMASREN